MFSTHRSLKRLLFVVIAGALLWPVGVQPALARNAADIVPATWYVSNTGDDLNSCAAVDAPCATINGAIAKATAGDTIEVAIGTYTGTGTGAEVVLINKNITLSGGWDAGFTAQSGRATIEGQAAFRGVTINDGMVVTIDSFVIQNGSDSHQGGGIRYSGNLTLSNSIVTHNASGWMGGGIFAYGTLTVNNSTISDNTAGSGGSGGGGGAGIELYSGTATLNNSTVSGNRIIGWYSGSAIDTMGTLFLNNATISGNTGSYALTTFVGHIVANNTTVTNNSGGINNNQGVVSLRNSILAGNGINGSVANCTGSIGSAGYNLVGDKTGCLFTVSTGDKVGTAAAPIDPKLRPLADNGGPTFAHALMPGSPALNAGNPATPGSGGNACLATDQRGLSRPAPADGICDIGAFELYRPHVASVTRASLNPTSSTSVAFTVTFSDGVTGVDIAAPFDDFALTAAGPTGASITSVSGSGATYTVTVNTGSGNGTLRLDVVDDGSILGGSGNPLGGPGAGNGNFTTGQEYTIQGPYVLSVARASPNPTSATTVGFTVTFSEPVTGVDTTSLFSDFALTTTGVTDPAIVGVSGSGAVYAVTVNTGSLNGTIRLDVVDDNSILDANGRPLGDTAVGDGNFTSGQVYTITKIPTAQAPAGPIWDTTPSYRWSKVPSATQYRLQLLKGTTVVYAKPVPASACTGATCSNTPTTQLVPRTYKWRVQALLGGIWQAYSPFKSLTLYAPKAGYWSGSWNDFSVPASRVQVANFSIYITISGCGNYKISQAPVSIDSKTGAFAFIGPFFANGTFSKTSTSPTSASGSVGLRRYRVSGCGYVTGGPFTWSASPRSADQVDLSSLDAGYLPATVTPMLDAPFGFLPNGSFTLDP